ncbi:MFS transporter [Pseudooceanicola sp. HF7]|uniref:MFS transporter n=1 Tax=Pseudooceanicola sp. HF7 TaxID=2721560 RepID=UPI0014304AEC|nr:MFS transporter [Pseudooceanicola sp. HF7]NIZ09146.1 MFS transporter [Pseudooceanicola sp. HF7]
MAITAFLPIMAIISLVPAVPTLIQHFADTPHAHTLIPLMLTAPGLMIAISAPFVGWAADAVGRRKLLLCSTLLYGICGTMPLYLHDLGAIFASRLGVGLSEAIVLTIANTMMMDYFGMDRRRFWLTVQGIVGPLAASAVIAGSGYLTEIHWNGAFWIYIVAFPLFLAMLVWMFEPEVLTRHADEPEIDDTTFPWGRIAAVAGITFVLAILYYIYTINGGSAFHSLNNAPPGRIGLVMSIVSLAVPAGALFFSFSSKRLSPEQVLGVMLVFIGIGMLGIGFSTNEFAMGVSAFVQQIGAGMAVSAMIFWVSSLFGPAHRGRAMGAWSSAFFAGMFVSPLIFSAFRGWAGEGVLYPFQVFGPVSLVIAVLMFAFAASPRGRALRIANTA